MPSPIGHVLGGVAVVWAADLVERRPSSDRLILAGALLAAAPDLDLLWPGAHRTATHSLTAVVIVMIIAAAVTGRVTRWRTTVVCGAAYASHLLLDWLGADNFPPRGIQLWWPFSDAWYISDWDLFRQTARQHFLSLPIIRQNLLAVCQELAILVPLLVAIRLVRVKALAGLSTQLSRRDHTAQ
jgi:inner membrane protein